MHRLLYFSALFVVAAALQGRAAPAPAPAAVPEFLIDDDTSLGPHLSPRAVYNYPVVQATMVAAGIDFSLALTKDKKVVAFGSNGFKQLTIPTKVATGRAVFIAAGGSIEVKETSTAGAIMQDASVIVWGDKNYGLTMVPVGLKAKQISLGPYHALAITTSGTVVAWGTGCPDCRKIPTGLKNVKQVVAAEGSSWALKNDGTLVGWGLGPGSVLPAVTKGIQSFAYNNNRGVALSTAGKVITWGHYQSWGGDFEDDAEHLLADKVAIGASAAVLALKNGTIVTYVQGRRTPAAIPDIRAAQLAMGGGNHFVALSTVGEVRVRTPFCEQQRGLPPPPAEETYLCKKRILIEAVPETLLCRAGGYVFDAVNRICVKPEWDKFAKLSGDFVLTKSGQLFQITKTLLRLDGLDDIKVPSNIPQGQIRDVSVIVHENATARWQSFAVVLKSGALKFFGSGTGGGRTPAVPSYLVNVALSSVSLTPYVGLALTAAGDPVRWNLTNPTKGNLIPAGAVPVNGVKQALLMADYSSILFLKNGSVMGWTDEYMTGSSAEPIQFPDGWTTNVAQFAKPGGNFVALFTNGTVAEFGPESPPLGAEKAVYVSVGQQCMYNAVTASGQVKMWEQCGEDFFGVQKRTALLRNVSQYYDIGNLAAIAVFQDGHIEFVGDGPFDNPDVKVNSGFWFKIPFSLACGQGNLIRAGKCQPINPCVGNAAKCSANAICSNTAPAVGVCKCKAGYKGDGKVCTKAS